MSESVARPSSVSSISSVSLVEIKTETHLVLQAFLHRTLSVPANDRPGRVGGAYKDHDKFSSGPQPRGDSQVDDVGSADEKKSGFKELMRNFPRRNKSSLERDAKQKLREDDVKSPSTTSEDEDGEKKPHKRLSQKKIRKRLSRFFKLRLEREKKDKEGRGSPPQRPSTLDIDTKPEPPAAVVSPSHPPAFYDEVAGKLEKIAQRSTSIKKPPRTPMTPSSSRGGDKEMVVQQLVHILCLEGDSMNTKIESDPFLRNKLNRLSYASFAKLLNTVSCSQVTEAPAAPPAASPTLRRLAVSMEVSRRIVTATGAQRLQDHAERYMDSFVPWVKSHGGWENVVDLEEHVEYD